MTEMMSPRHRPPRPGHGAGVVLAAAVAAVAAWLAATADGMAAPRSIERSLPLNLPGQYLRGGSSALETDLHLGGPLAVQGSVVTLTYTNALSVLPDGSSLQLLLNGRPIAKLPVVAAQGAVTARIAIPPTAFVPGRNRLAIAAEQRHRVACSREAFDELWTRIDPERSGLALTLEPRTANLTLAELPGLLSASIYDGEPIVVLSARDTADARLLGWGSSVAQALATIRGDRPQAFEAGRLIPAGAREGGSGGDGGLTTHVWQRLAGRNVAVVGTTAELAPLIGSTDLAGLAGGAVAVRALPADPGHVAVILTGPDDESVGRAVQAFGAGPRDWPALTRVEVGGLRSAGTTEPAPAWLPDGGSWSLAELGYAGRDLPVGFAGTREVAFDLPPDYYAGDGQRLTLRLNYAYGAGLDPTSALHIEVNGAPWNMVRLDRPAGAVVEGARIELPMGLLRPGRNRIGFTPTLQPASGDLCAAGGKAMFSLFDDSRLELAPFARLSVQPDLGAFAASGYPFAHRPASDQVELVVLGGDPATVAAAWTLHGKLAQLRGRPVAAGVTGSLTPSAAHLLVVGEAGVLPPSLLAAAPVPLGPAGDTPGPDRPAGRTPPSGATGSAAPPAHLDARQKWRQRLNEQVHGEDDGLLRRLVGRASAAGQAEPAEANRPPAAAGSAFGPEAAVLAAFESPFAPGRTVAVVTAPRARDLPKAVDRLIRPATWERLEGDVLRWDAGTGEAFAGRAGGTFAIDPLPREPRQLALAARAFLSRNPAWWIGVLAVLLCGFAVATRATLRALREART